jgi:hypothetical protein
MRFIRFINLASAICYLSLSACAHAQEVQTLELTTSVVHPLTARLGSACLIQLPVEATATNVGDPAMWLVEKQDRLVSIKAQQAIAKDTTLAVVTRQGTISFSVHLAPDSEPFTQMVRVTRIVDDSKPLTASPRAAAPETLANIVIREIRIAQNYYALKMAKSPDLREVEQFTQLRECGNHVHDCTLLQTFRFRDTRHVLLHFVTRNQTENPMAFAHRQTTVRVGDTIFAPVAISLGSNPLSPKASAENFIILNGANGLSPRQKFDIDLVVEAQPATSADAP